MMDWRLRRHLDKAALRLKHWQLLWQSTFLWLFATGIGGLLIAWHRTTGGRLPGGAYTLASAAAVAWVGLAVALWWRSRNAGYYRRVAQRVEQRFPDLNAGLLTALDVVPAPLGVRLGYLDERVLTKALAHAYHERWERVVPGGQLARLHLGHAASFAALGVVLYFLGGASGTWPKGTRDAAMAAAQAGDFELTVDPGNTEIERGTALLVMARFRGALPPEATLVYEDQETTAPAGAATEEEPSPPRGGSIKMSKALNDPLYGASVPNVLAPLTYRIEFAGRRSDVFRVELFEFPRLVKADATLVFPAYTAAGEKLIQDVRHVSAVQGTQITLRCRLNKPVVSAQLVDKDGTAQSLTEVDPAAFDYEVRFTLDQSRRCELKLADAKGRENKDRVEFVFTALPNNPPDLKLAAPGRDVEVSPLEELDLRAKAFDDFGLRRVGVNFAMAGKDEQELVLASDVGGKQPVDVAQLVALESLRAEPDQLLAYYFWAEDTGPDGAVRRVASDMYFAEVQPFDEIFRQGEPPPGGESPSQGQQGSGAANAAQELAQLQKEIMNATWKLIRRETTEPPTSDFAKDMQLVHESQTSALAQANELTEQVQDPQSTRYVTEVLQHMETAIRELATARDRQQLNSLRPALDAEQAAYQALLKLRAREHQVVRSRQQRQRGASSSSRSQQQLQQMQLRDQENRYETERAAQAEESQAEQETRQVLSRLRELARRQDDLNERLKELEAELQQAETEEQREELRQQLKRLQEEQERILRDTDELQARLDQPENSQQLADTRQQLNDARERVLQSSEALREGQVPQAVTAGTRAQEQFENLREDLRKQTSAHFQRQMRQLQQQAQELEQKEQQLATDMQKLTDPTERTTSLRDAGDRDRISEEIGQQQQRLNDLLEGLRETVEEAEQPQPLLANQLYDATRVAQQRDLGRGLDTTRQLLRRGFDEQARQQEAPVGQAITELRAGIDRAAEGILGDESEALRRAQSQLENLARDVQDELGENGRESGKGENRKGENRKGENRKGENRKEESGKGESGKGESGKGESGKGESGKGESGKGESGKGESGKGESGKGESGKGESGKGESGKGESGKGESGKGESGKGESGKGESGKGESGKGESGKGESGKGESGKGESGKGESGKGESGKGESGKGESGQGGEGQGGQGGGSGGGGGERGRNGEPADGSPPRRGVASGRGEPGERPGEGQPGGLDRLAGFGGPQAGTGNAPFTGGNFREWSDRLRDVEEMLSDPELSAEAARIRERARAIRAESQRHSLPPNWELVEMQVAEPLTELYQKVSQELWKRTGSEELVPIDRDPVPPEFSHEVQRYFEQLGTGQ